MEKLIQIIEDDERFELQPEDPDTGEKLGSRIFYRRVPQAERNRITRQHTTTKRNKRTGASGEVVDFEALGRDLIAYAALDWSGIVGGDGKEIPFDRALLQRLPDGILAQILDAVRTTSSREVADLGN